MCLGGGGQPTTTNKPLYQPTGEGGADTAWQNIAGNLYNQFTAGQSPGQVYWGPTQQFVGQATNNPYNQLALRGAKRAINQWTNQAAVLYPNAIGNLYDLGNQANSLGAYVAGITPQIQQEIASSPYFSQAMSGAEQAANYGLGGASQAYGQSQLLNSLGSSLPSWALSLANQTMAPAGEMQQVAAGLPGYGQQQAGTTEAPVNFLQNLAFQAPGVAQSYANLMTGQIPALTAGAGRAEGTFSPMVNAGNQILQQGFDPQSALFNRTQQQLIDQSNAINAMSGLSASPYGAGVTGQNLSNFDINWQNNLLNRMATAGSAAQGLYGQGLAGLAQGGALRNEISNLAQGASGVVNAGQSAAANLSGQAGNLMSQGSQQYLNALAQMNSLNQGAANLYGQGSNIYNQGLGTSSNLLGQSTNLAQIAPQLAMASNLPQQVYNQNLMQQLSALNSGAGTLGGLMGSAGGAYGQAGNLLNQYTQGTQNLFAQPYNLYNAMQGNNLAALAQGVNIGNQQYQLPENLLGNAQAYMGLGQSASSISNQIAAQNFAEQQSSMSGLGSLLGMNGMFGPSAGYSSTYGGGGGLFGGGGGLLGGIGSLFGGGGAAGGGGLLGFGIL